MSGISTTIQNICMYDYLMINSKMVEYTRESEII